MITGAVTAQAYQLQKHLDKTAVILLADSAEIPQFQKNSRFVQIPHGNSPSFAHLLLTICLDLEVDVVYPLRINELLALSEARQLFDEYGIKLMTPEKDAIRSLLNKGVRGRIIIKDGITDDGMPDRGAFLFDDASQQFQLLTAD